MFEPLWNLETVVVVDRVSVLFDSWEPILCSKCRILEINVKSSLSGSFVKDVDVVRRPNYAESPKIRPQHCRIMTSRILDV